MFYYPFAAKDSYWMWHSAIVGSTCNTVSSGRQAGLGDCHPLVLSWTVHGLPVTNRPWAAITILSDAHVDMQHGVY
jgi:hypothetical protein